jgi:hypothetical protein
MFFAVDLKDNSKIAYAQNYTEKAVNIAVIFRHEFWVGAFRTADYVSFGSYLPTDKTQQCLFITSIEFRGFFTAGKQGSSKWRLL